MVFLWRCIFQTIWRRMVGRLVNWEIFGRKSSSSNLTCTYSISESCLADTLCTCQIWARIELIGIRQHTEIYYIYAGHGSRVVWGMHRLRSLGSRDRGFESHSRHGVLLCLGRGLATNWSPVQGVLPSVQWSRNWEISPSAPTWDEEEEKSYIYNSLYS
jgi:hypothetical protein